MTRLVLIVAGVVVGVLALAVLWLALLPPEPRTQRIERPVPIDRSAPAPATPAPTAVPAPAVPPPAVPPRR